MTVPVTNALAALAVSDIAISADWYARLLGRPATAEPMTTLQEWQFPQGGWMQLYVNAAIAGRSAVTLTVADIAACRNWLAAENYPNVQSIDSATASVAIVLDPDGNQVVFAQSNNPVTNPSVVVPA